MGFKITGSIKPTGILHVKKTPGPYPSGDMIRTDWKVLGDEKTTLNTTTGLEWLDLNETKNKSIIQVKSELATTYAGFRLATETEITALFDERMLLSGRSAYSWDPNTWSMPSKYTYKSFLDHMAFQHSTRRYALGWFERTNGTWWYAGVNATISNTSAELGGVNNDNSKGFGASDVSNIINNGNVLSAYMGTWLVSDGGATLTSQNNPSINIPG